MLLTRAISDPNRAFRLSLLGLVACLLSLPAFSQTTPDAFSAPSPTPPEPP